MRYDGEVYLVEDKNAVERLQKMEFSLWLVLFVELDILLENVFMRAHVWDSWG